MGGGFHALLQSVLRRDGVLRGSAAVAQITEREGVTKETKTGSQGSSRRSRLNSQTSSPSGLAKPTGAAIMKQTINQGGGVGIERIEANQIIVDKSPWD